MWVLIQLEPLFYLFQKMIPFRRFCDSQWSSAKSKFWKNENLWLKLHFVFRCASRLLAASPGNFSYFYLEKMKNSPLSKPYFRLFWPAKLIKTLFDYFNHKIKPKPSLDGTLSPNTISISEGLYCTVLSHFNLNL